MTLEHAEAIRLKAPVRREKTWAYPWLGFLLGVAAGVLTGHPLAMVVYNLHDYILGKARLDIIDALVNSFQIHMWPMILLYTLFGGGIGALLGHILQRLRENRLRLDTLHQEFELQVATLRHHYKNLALGIQGFSSRIKRKLVILDDCFRKCAQENCPTYGEFFEEFNSVEKGVTILEEASQRLTHILGQELLFLKALTTDTLTPMPRDFYPLLRHCIKDLQSLRFQEKEVRVDINGKPMEECRDSLIFPFEPYTMEVILQNILANAMKYGDAIHLTVTARGDRVLVKVQDNGPGLDVKKLKEYLLIPQDRRESESTHLGLRVTLHLLEKCGGRLGVWSEPGAGATFILEFPK